MACSKRNSATCISDKESGHRGFMEYFDFLNESVSPWHTVESLRQEFVSAGFEEMQLLNGATAKLGAAYMFVRGAAVVALRVPLQVNESTRFRIVLAHTDFPALKISPNPDRTAAGASTLHAEVYGSPIYSTWLDRDLGYAGVLAYEKDGNVQTKLVRGSKLFRIPSLAVHLNRGVNQDGTKVDPQADFNALWQAATADGKASAFADALQGELGVAGRLLDFDIQLFDAQPASFGGFNDEWIYSGRLDNLGSCHAVARALASASAPANDFCVACFCNNEEIGSETREGACGNFLRSVLECVWNAVGGNLGNASLSAIFGESFALSVDAAHAVHPNHPEKHEANHSPVLGGGIVLKANAQKRYASDAVSSARLRLLCEQANVPCQTFVMRNDMPCGSTVGPAISASLGIPTVDIGEPMLSMHSIREMTAVKDHESMVRLVAEFFR